MKRMILSFFLLLMMLSCQPSPEVIQQGDIPFVPMEAERLPDLNEPRIGHALVWAGNHILAVGGHTTGFVPSVTAEYFENRRWHTISTLYPHDTPFALVLKDGDVLIGGGYETSFGIGQTWGVERYHPAIHDFTPAPIMEEKRAHASALELEDGRIVISGNWWATDITEIYNGDSVWTDTTSDNRSYPILLPIAKDNVWIIGGTYGSYGSGTQNIVDQIKGEPFSVDLLAEWRPQTPRDRNRQADACRVAENTFLIPALNAEGQCAPMLVDSTGFSLLPMEQPLPTEGPWGTIRYTGSFWTVPETEMAWLMGMGEKHAYLAEIDYQPSLQGGKAKLTMHYSQALEDFPANPWEMLLPDGSFVTVGGMLHSNYESSASVFAFYPKGAPHKYATVLFMGIGLAMMIGLFLIFMARKRKHQLDEDINTSEEIAPSNDKPNLGDRLKVLMEEQQLFRNKDLRIADVAAALCTNTTYLSTFLNTEMNTTFPAFVTGYRIRYAQELMRKDPAMRLSQVAEESGFTNEKTFLRSFKASCGVTPSEWKQQ
jgi:AraC-like DNA-binding protein